MICFIALTLVSCQDENHIKAPSNLQINEEDLLTWDHDDGMEFVVLIDGIEYKTTKRSFDLKTIVLEPDNYEIRVKVKANSADLPDSNYSRVIKYNVKEMPWLNKAIRTFYLEIKKLDPKHSLTASEYTYDYLIRINEYSNLTDQELYNFFLFGESYQGYIEPSIQTITEVFKELPYNDDQIVGLVYGYLIVDLTETINMIKPIQTIEQQILDKIDLLYITVDELKKQMETTHEITKLSRVYFLIQEIDRLKDENNKINSNFFTYHENNLKDTIESYDFIMKVWRYETLIKNKDVEEIQLLETSYSWLKALRPQVEQRIFNQQLIDEYEIERKIQPAKDINNYQDYDMARREYLYAVENIDKNRQTYENELKSCREMMAMILEHTKPYRIQLEYLLNNKNTIYDEIFELLKNMKN